MLELAGLGADFTRRADGQLSLHREGGHSHRRIVHAADVTGREIERALLEAASANSNIQFFEHHSALDLVMSEVRQPPADMPCSLPSATQCFINCPSPCLLTIWRMAGTFWLAKSSYHLFHTDASLLMLQIQGTKVCLGVDALNEGGASLTRFVAPVTMLATGGAGQVTFPLLCSAARASLLSSAPGIA